MHLYSLFMLCVPRVMQVTTPEEYVGAVLSDLTSLRRAQIERLSEGGHGESVVTAHVPLATLLVRSMIVHVYECDITSPGTGLCQQPPQSHEWNWQLFYGLLWPLAH